MRIMKHELQDAMGTIQLCAGQDSGCEAAVHAMDQVLDTMILVDTLNEFIVRIKR